MLASLQNNVVKAEQQYKQLLQKLSTQGNASNIPGLSVPGASAAVAGGAVIGGFPSLGGGGSSINAGGLTYPTMAMKSNSSGYPSIG